MIDVIASDEAHEVALGGSDGVHDALPTMLPSDT